MGRISTSQVSVKPDSMKAGFDILQISAITLTTLFVKPPRISASELINILIANQADIRGDRDQAAIYCRTIDTMDDLLNTTEDV